MRIAACSAFERERLAQVHEYFAEMQAWLSGLESSSEHGEVEAGLEERSRELARRMYQLHLDRLSQAERRQHAGKTWPKGMTVRVRSRQLETVFGRVVFTRMVFKVAGEPGRCPLDAQLNLPADLYSRPLRKRVTEEARRGSWDQAVATIARMTAARVPKRQAEELTTRAAEDVNAFYASRKPPTNDTLSAAALQVMSCDSKGVTMRPESLREATRKEAEAAAKTAVRGDPMAQRKLRKHDKRMAIVTAVWEQEPMPRTAKDVVDRLGPRRAPATKDAMPKPQNKRVSASVAKTQATGIAEMFDEAERRDPEHARTTVALVDGEERQLEAIAREARARGMTVHVVLDVIHVLHYLWLAGLALCRKNEAAAEAWVATYLVKLLTRPAVDVASGIRQAATVRRLTTEERRPVEKCVAYLLRNASALRYREFLARGFPIATGVIEGACRHLVQDRLGITGARWHLQQAEAVLLLRAVHTSGDWPAYWAFHERSDANRLYAA